jgi:hypothetical protein
MWGEPLPHGHEQYYQLLVMLSKPYGICCSHEMTMVPAVVDNNGDFEQGPPRAGQASQQSCERCVALHQKRNAQAEKIV